VSSIGSKGQTHWAGGSEGQPAHPGQAFFGVGSQVVMCYELADINGVSTFPFLSKIYPTIQKAYR
jgi:hypothetical protein